MSLATLAYGLMLSPKARFCFRSDLREGNLGSYSRNYSLVDMQNEDPSGGECIEQPRTIVIRIRAFISNISKILLTVPLLNYQKKEAHHDSRVKVTSKVFITKEYASILTTVS